MEDFKPINVDFIINDPEVKRSTDKVKRDISGTTDTAEKAVSRVNNALEEQVADWNKVGQAANRARPGMAKVGTAATGVKTKFNGLSNSVNQLTREFPAFAVSAQTGILAISNNIPILVDEINRLKLANAELTASGQKGIPVWRQVTKALFGWQTLLSVGIGLLTIYGKDIANFFRELIRGEKVLDDVMTKQEALNKAFETDSYKKAVKDIISLESNLQLAKEGTINATSVVDQYNESLGKAAGSAKDLRDVEDGLIKNKDAYIQMMLFKSAANLALDESAQAALMAAKEQLKLEEDLAATQEKIAAKEAAGDIRMSVGRGSRSEYATLLDREKALQQELTKNQEANNKAIDARNRLYEKLNKTAQSFGLDAFLESGGSGEGDAAQINARQRLLDRIAELDREYARKRLADDQAEVQALKDKFAKIRQEVERFNAKSENKIDLGALDGIQEQALKDLLARQEEAREEARQKKKAAELKAEQEKYDALMQKLMSYHERKLAIEDEYAEAVVLLATKYEGDAFEAKLAELMRQKDEELKVLEEAAFKESELYRELNTKILGMTRQQITQQLALLKQALEQGMYKTADGTLLNLTEEQMAELRKVIGEMEGVLASMDVNKLQQMADGFQQISQSAREMSAALEGTADGLSATFETIGDLSQIGSDAATSVGQFATGNVIGGVASAIRAISGIFSIAKKSRESYRKAREELKQIIAEAEDGERRLNALQRERNIQKAKELELTLASLDAQRQALLISERQINSESARVFQQLQQQSFISGSRTEKYGGFLGIGRKTRVVNEYSSLLGKTFEEIEQLFERGKLEGRAKELFEELRKLKAEGQDVERQLADLQDQANQILTGTTSEGIADGIINGLRNGYTAVEDFAGDMEKLLQNAILNAIKYQVLEEPLQELYKKFAEFAESDGQLTAEEAEKIRKMYEDNVQKAVDAYQQFSQIIDQDALNGGQQRGLAGAIRRELTEETGSELTGLFRGQYDVTKRHLELSEKWYQAEQVARDQMMSLTTQIEINTRAAAARLVEAVSELRQIRTNTKPAQGSRDQGRG